MVRDPRNTTPETGQRYTFTEVVSQETVDSFVRFSGDDNPLHVDDCSARRLGFRSRVAHGAILISFVSRAIGTALPGAGSLWLSSDFEFAAPVFLDDSITISVEVEHFSIGLGVALLNIQATNQNGRTVMTGSGKVKILEEAMSTNFIPIEEQRVLVTGGTRGLGKTTSKALLEAGARVAVTYKSNDEAAMRMKSECANREDRLLVLKCDITNSRELDGLFSQLERRFSGICSFVHSASPPLNDIALEELGWEICNSFLETYIKAGIEIVQGSLRYLKESSAGRVVFISSESVQAPKKQWVHYVTAKSALHGLRNALSLELGEIGTSVNTISPGLIHTSDVLPQNVKMLTKNATPLKKLVTEEEIAETVLFLLEKGGSFISGANIPLTGGRVLFS